MKTRPEYEEFIAWLRESGAFVPDSPELLPLIEATYTPDEVRALIGIPLRMTQIEELAALKRMDRSVLESRLDALAQRGLVFSIDKGGRKLFRLGDPRFIYLRSIFWRGRKDRYTQRLATRVNNYYRDGFGDYWKDAEQKGLRVLPIGRTIEDPRTILPYEDTMGVLDRQDRIAVAFCACRHRKEMAPESPVCEYPKEVCLHFGNFADYIVQTEIGRAISSAEAADILVQCADAGLVHSVSNWRHGVDTICNCCRCCCVYFEAFYVLKHSRVMDPSNYEIDVSPESCKGCGLCVKRCPMEAITLQPSDRVNNKSGKSASLKPNLCIGCGVCAHKCPTGSLVLKRRARTVDPLATAQKLKDLINVKYLASADEASR